jgi:hypothetical protein
MEDGDEMEHQQTVALEAFIDSYMAHTSSIV